MNSDESDIEPAQAIPVPTSPPKYEHPASVPIRDKNSSEDISIDSPLSSSTENTTSAENSRLPSEPVIDQLRNVVQPVEENQNNAEDNTPIKSEITTSSYSAETENPSQTPESLTEIMQNRFENVMNLLQSSDIERSSETTNTMVISSSSSQNTSNTSNTNTNTTTNTTQETPISINNKYYKKKSSVSATPPSSEIDLEISSLDNNNNENDINNLKTDIKTKSLIIQDLRCKTKIKQNEIKKKDDTIYELQSQLANIKKDKALLEAKLRSKDESLHSIKSETKETVNVKEHKNDILEKQIHYLEVQLRNKNYDLLHLQDKIYKLSKNEDVGDRRRNSSISSLSSLSSLSNKRSKSVTPSTRSTSTFLSSSSNKNKNKKITKTPNYIEPKDIMSSESVINEFVKDKKERKINKNKEEEEDDDDDISIKLKKIHDKLNPDPYYEYFKKMNQSFPYPIPSPYLPPNSYPITPLSSPFPPYPPFVCKNCEEKSRIEADLKRRLNELQYYYNQNMNKMKSLEAENKELKNKLNLMAKENEKLYLQDMNKPTEKNYNLLLIRVKELEAELRKYNVNTTREGIISDKINVLNAKDPELSHRILVDICKKLLISDVNNILPSIDRMNNVMKGVVKMEKYINQIKNIVQSVYGEESLGVYDIIPILEDWKEIVVNR